MASPSAHALITLAAHLGVSASSSCKDTASIIKSPVASLLVQGDEDDDDFSSFPSLSLEESPGNYHRGIFTNRGDVESHVESLLSRPILLGKPQEESVDDLESDSLDEFLVENLNEVPRLMLSNFCASFSTLMHSRLRAYVSFMAHHSLTLASEHEDEGVMGIAQKMEAMLSIGSRIAVTADSSELTVGESRREQESNEATSDDAMTYQESLPVKMKICIHISLPHAVNEVGCSESMTASFQTSGTICGIFSSDRNSLLRVAEVSLSMHELLTGMAEQASKVISRIVEMTNATYSVPPPLGDSLRAATPHSGEQSGKRKVSWSEDAADDLALSAERCANIVDFVIGEVDEKVLLPPPIAKKAKLST